MMKPAPISAATPGQSLNRLDKRAHALDHPTTDEEGKVISLALPDTEIPQPDLALDPGESYSSSSGNKNTGSVIAILASFLGSTGLATVTHFKDDILGPLTKPVKYLSVFAALFTATIGAAVGLSPKNHEEGSSTSLDFSHSLH